MNMSGQVRWILRWSEVFQNSAFLTEYRQLIATHTRGCVVLERPDLLQQLVTKHGAKDATARGSAREELEALIAQFPADTAALANLAVAEFLRRDMARAVELGRQAELIAVLDVVHHRPDGHFRPTGAGGGRNPVVRTDGNADDR